MQRQKFASLIRFSRVLSLSLLVVMLGGLLKPEAAIRPVSFGAKTDFGTGSLPVSVGVGDFHSGGKLDLAVANDGADNDYQANSGRLTLLPTDTKKQITVIVNRDRTFESDEAFTVHLSGASGAPIGAGLYPPSTAVGGAGTFTNDDVARPTLGDYPDVTVQAGANTTVTPDAAPTNTTSMNVSTSTAFRGAFAASPTTGVVMVTNAHLAGTYTVTVRAFNSGNVIATKTFTLTVTNPTHCDLLSFSQASGSPFTADSYPYAVAVGDFNGDGKQDLTTANAGGDNLTVLLGDGAGGFTAASGSPFGVGPYPQSVAVSDFNGDGKLDLTTTDTNSQSVTVLLGNGAGGFTAASSSPFAVGLTPYSVAVGDFNGDGKSDLVTTNSFAHNVTVLLGDGAGGFTTASGSPFTVGLYPESVAESDFNGDGTQDLAIANYSSNNVMVFLGNGLGGFTQAIGSPFAVGSDPQSVAVGDFNGDGTQDLATANGAGNMTVLLGNGLGGFSEASGSPFPVGPNPFSVAVGDFNGDGKQDLSTPSSYSNNVTVLLNTCCTFTLDRDHQSFAGNGGVGTVNVNASDPGCPWTASTSATFIHITSGTPGVGNGALQYAVDINPGPTIRSDTITIAGHTYTVYQGIDFLDVPPNHLFYDDIGKLAARGVTVGCGGGNYCPNSPVTREQMAAFILRAKSEFDPPTPATQRFTDVPPANVFYGFIDRLAELGITLGCTPDHLMYCPSDPVKREQMAAFILRGLGEFDPPTPDSQRFDDVPSTNVFYNFIDRLAALQITLGCTPDHLMYCPSDSVTRAQMAAFLVRAFNL